MSVKSLEVHDQNNELEAPDSPIKIQVDGLSEVGNSVND